MLLFLFTHYFLLLLINYSLRLVCLTESCTTATKIRGRVVVEELEERGWDYGGGGTKEVSYTDTK